MSMVKRGVAGAFVSAGNTGAVMASALMTLGRIQGIERPALGTVAPYSEAGVLVLDVGANADVKPNYLVQFAQMGSAYAERVLGIANPRVALLNIGGEDTKGSELVQEVYGRLGKAGVNFVGNIEGGEVHHGKADVIVTDGFTGNVAVKVTEGVADFLFRESCAPPSRQSCSTSSPRWCCAPACSSCATAPDRHLRRRPLLGVNGVVMIAHGNSDARAIKNAIRFAHDAASSGMLDSIRAHLQYKA